MRRHPTSLALLFSVVCLGLSAMEMGVARFAPQPLVRAYGIAHPDLGTIENAITDLDYRVTDYAFAPDGTVTPTDRQPFTPWKRFLLNHTPYGWLNQHSHLFVLGKDELARLSAAHLDRLATVLENAGVPLVVVWIPSWDEIAGQGDTVKLELMARSVAALKEVAARRGFAFIDPDTLMAARRAAMPAADSLRLPDGHFNVAGNRWFAELIEPALAQSLSRALGRDR